MDLRLGIAAKGNSKSSMGYNIDNSGLYWEKNGATKYRMLNFYIPSNLKEMKNFEWALSDEDKSKDQNLPAMETLIRLNRLRYFGHVLRMDDSLLPKIVINSEVNAGERARGCPKKNYRACIKEDLKLFGMWEHYPDLVITASERSLWRRKIHQGAIVFQKKWEEDRIAQSLTRKMKQNNLNNTIAC